MTRTQRLLRSLLALAALAVLVLLVYWRTPREEPWLPPLSKPCVDQLALQQRLAELAVRGMQSFNRIDPGLYVSAGQGASPGGGIALAPGLEPILPENSEPRLALSNLLAEINADPALLQAFVGAHAKAVQTCAKADCPATAYTIRVENKFVENNPGAEYWQFDVEGKTPSVEAWTLGFLTQYGAEAAPGCGFEPPLHLLRSDQGYGREPGQLPSPSEAQLKTPPAPAPARGEAVSELYSLKGPKGAEQISTGFAEKTAICASANPSNTCEKSPCTMPNGNHGKAKYDHGTWCCVSGC